MNELIEDKPFENYLITGNVIHFPKDPFILKPADFVKLLDEDFNNNKNHSYER